MLCCGDTDAASAVNALAGLVHQSAGVTFARHGFTRARPILVAVRFVFLRVCTQGARKLLAAVALHAACSGGDKRGREEGCGVYTLINFRF